MRLLLVAIAIIILALVALGVSGRLDSSQLYNAGSETVDVSVGNKAQSQFDIESGTASEAPAPTNSGDKAP